jgi:hypothetical protein
MNLKRIPFLLLFVLPFALPKTYGNERPASGVKPSNGAFHFIENKGQLKNIHGGPASEVLFYGRLNDANVYFTRNSIIYDFSVAETSASTDANAAELSDSKGPLSAGNNKIIKYRHYRVDMEFQDVNPSTLVVGAVAESGVNNYYTGNNQKDWLIEVRLFSKLRYENIYPGIDLIIHSDASGKGIKYDLVLKPGADPSRIKYRYKGASASRITAQQELKVETPLGNILELAPVSYQVIDGQKINVPSRFVNNNGLIGFSAESYKRNQPLIIDPGILVWSTYYGGSGNSDVSRELITDRNGDIVIAGETNSSNFPTSPGAAYTTFAGNSDAFIVKFSASGTRLWGTYLGGSVLDVIESCASNSLNEIVFTGYTNSTNVPTINPGGGAYYTAVNRPNTTSPYPPGCNSTPFNSLLGKMSPTGALLWSTYLDGDIFQAGIDVCVDQSDNMIFTGYTASPESRNFPLRNADQNFYAGPASANCPTQTIYGDAYVGVFNKNYVMQWMTYFGGPNNETGQAVAVDSKGNVYLTGEIFLGGYNNHISPFQPAYGGGSRDNFIVKYSPSGVRRWSTYYGGGGGDAPLDMAVIKNYLYITGRTSSVNLPGPSTGVDQPNNAGGFSDGYLVKIDTAASPNQILWKTYNGGTNEDAQVTITSNSSGNIIIGGNTKSADFPAFQNAYQNALGGSFDGTFTTFSDQGKRICASFFGGNFADYINGIATAANGDLFITGSTGSRTADGFKVTPNPFQAEKQGSSADANLDAFVARISDITDKPEASFTAVPEPGCAPPFKVKITNNSKLNSGCLDAATILWSFPGATVASSTDQNPADAIYNASGTYTIKLTITNSMGSDEFEQTITFNNSIKVNAGKDTTICKGQTVKLTATGADSYSWSPATGLDNTNSQSVNATPASTIQYRVSGTKAGCVVIPDTVKVTVIDSPVINVSKDTTICQGQGVTLTASGADTYIWSPATGLNTTNTPVVIAKPDITTTYTITGKKGGCNAIPATVKVTIIPNDVKITAGNDTSICEGESINLAATGADSYLWSPAAGLNTTTAPVVIAKPTVSTSYVINGFKGSCPAIPDTVNVSVIPSNIKINAGKDTSICKGQSINLTASGADTYNWSPATGLSDPTAALVVANPVSTTQYIISGTKSGCPVIPDTVKVTVSEVINIIVNADTTICAGSSILLTASGADEYTWSPATGLNATSGFSVTATPVVTTNYTVNGKKGSCQVNPASVNVSVESIDTEIEATIEPNAEAPYELIASDKSINADVCSWILKAKNGQEKIFSGLAELSTTINEPGDYVLKLICTSSAGCQDEDSVSFKILAPEVKLIVPNVFNPESSVDLNRNFNLELSGIKDLKGKIFNRWGKEIYAWEGTQSDKFWDGTINGKDAPDGVYFFVIEAFDFFGNKVLAKGPNNQPLPDPIRGTVTLIRGGK